MSSVKTADISEVVRRMGRSLKPAGTDIAEWYNKIDPDARKAILRGLVGAGIGAGITGSIAALTPKDPDEDKAKAVINPTLLGAVLGGAGAAGLPVAGRLLSGALPLKGEAQRPIGTVLTDTILGVPLRNPAATIGTGLGLTGFGMGTAPWLREGFRRSGGILAGLPQGQLTLVKSNIINAIKHKDTASLRDALLGLKDTVALSGRNVGKAFSKGQNLATSTAKSLAVALKKDPTLASSLAKSRYRGGAAGLVALPALGIMLDKYIRGDA